MNAKDWSQNGDDGVLTPIAAATWRAHNHAGRDKIPQVRLSLDALAPWGPFNENLGSTLAAARPT